jgi:hypothetical protein
MPYGYGYGYGFRGASPPWPYVGRGRGGLPRCWHPGLWAGYWQMPPADPYFEPYYGPPWMGPYYPGSPAEAAYPPASYHPPRMTRDEEIQYLKEQAQAVKEDLDDIQARIDELESE